jgi:3-methyladenine DNA glycosylase/8-oxoguanine DNA glycosylase
VRLELRPVWPYRLPGGGADGLLRRRGGLLERLLHVDGEPVVIRAAQVVPSRVVLGAWSDSAPAAAEGLARMRFALGIDDDLRPFHERFRWDPLIGRLLRADPRLRVRRAPEPFEAFAWAVCEQLIESERARGIQRRLVATLGSRCPVTGLRDAPAPTAVVRAGSARLEACGLSAGRAVALVRAAREVSAGRVDLRAPDPEPGWARLRAIPGVGPWTIEMLALRGQGRLDQVPAGDLGLLKALGRARTGNPRSRAAIDEVRELFSRYDPYAGLAATYVLRAGRTAAELLRAGLRAPDPGGTRWSAPGRHWAAG